MRAISTFRRDDGISTRACRAIVAFRMRESMSAIGSVITLISVVFSFQSPVPRAQSSLLPTGHWRLVTGALPRTLRHSGDVAFQRQLAEAQAAERELTQVGARTAAALAAM